MNSQQCILSARMIHLRNYTAVFLETWYGRMEIETSQ